MRNLFDFEQVAALEILLAISMPEWAKNSDYMLHVFILLTRELKLFDSQGKHVFEVLISGYLNKGHLRKSYD